MQVDIPIYAYGIKLSQSTNNIINPYNKTFLAEQNCVILYQCVSLLIATQMPTFQIRFMTIINYLLRGSAAFYEIKLFIEVVSV